MARQLVARGSTTVERQTWISMQSDSPARAHRIFCCCLQYSYYYSHLFAIPILVLWVRLGKGTKIWDVRKYFGWLIVSIIIFQRVPSFVSYRYLLFSFWFSLQHHPEKIGTANGWKTTKSNPPGPIKLSTQSETRSSQ